MTCSTSYSSRAAVALGLVLALVAGGRAIANPRSGSGGAAPFRIAVLPPENLGGRGVPTNAFLEPLTLSLVRQGMEVVGRDEIGAFLARHRIRYTGGLDQQTARAAREELGVDGVLILGVELRREQSPAVGVVGRLVSTTDGTILWMDGVSTAGDESPGFLNLGMVTTLPPVEAEAVRRLAGSLSEFVGKSTSGQHPCESGGWWLPRKAFRGELDVREPRSVVVLPFVNYTSRRSAGEVAALEFARQVFAAPEFKLVEPGRVRRELLRNRVVMEDGVSLDQARLLSDVLDADLVLAGYVYAYDDTLPLVDFTVLVLERATGRVVWQSTSYNRGDDSATAFDIRRVATAPDLLCRMVRNVVDELSGRERIPPSARR